MEDKLGYHERNMVVEIEQGMTTALFPSLLTPTWKTTANCSHLQNILFGTIFVWTILIIETIQACISVLESFFFFHITLHIFITIISCTQKMVDFSLNTTKQIPGDKLAQEEKYWYYSMTIIYWMVQFYLVVQEKCWHITDPLQSVYFPKWLH